MVMMMLPLRRRSRCAAAGPSLTTPPRPALASLPQRAAQARASALSKGIAKRKATAAAQ